MTTKTAEKKTTKELQREDPDFLPTTYGLTKSKIAKLKKEYSVMPEALVKGDEGYEIVHKKAMAIVKVRTSIEKKKKELTDDARKWTNLVNSEAKRLTEVVAEIEKPWKDKKAELDKAEEIKAEQERLAELTRTEAIESRVNMITAATENLLGATASILDERLNYIKSIVIDESFEEYEDIAIKHRDTALAALQTALSNQQQLEKQQEQMAADRLESERVKQELADTKAELERLKAPAEPNQSNSNYSTDRLPLQKAYRTYDEVVSEHAAIQSEDVKPYIALTERQMVQAYAQSLLDIPVPDVGEEKMVNLVNQMTSNLEKLNNFVLTNTQEGG